MKNKDVFGSPADYDISIRLGKDCHFGENPKFQGNVTKNGTMSFVLYSSSNRSSRSPLTCSTPKVSINKKRMNIRKRKSRRSQGSVEKKISSNQPGQQCQENVENVNNGDMFDEFENLPSTSGSVKRREFNLPNVSGSVNRRESSLTSTSSSVNRGETIDDDSDDLTISEKSEEIPGNRTHLFERINNQRKINKSKRESTFREMVLEKIDKIEKYVEQLRKVLAYLNGKIQTGQIQEQHDKENEKIYLNSVNNTMFRKKYDEIIKIIADAIKNLRDEFENKRKASLKHIEENIYQFIEKMHIRSKNDTEHIRKMCETTSADLIKKVINILSAMDVGELEHESSKLESSDHESFEHDSFEHESSKHESSEDFNIMIREIERRNYNTNNGTDTYFSYENTCKVLSDQLWSSKNELDVLEQEKLDITVKFSDIQKSLEKQESLMDILQTEINNLRLDVTKNV